MSTPEPTPRPEHALLAGGGSGGHVFPGLAVADELSRRGWAVSWTGAPDSLEERLVDERGLPFFPLRARPVVGQGLAGKARAAITLLRSAFGARRLVQRLDARVVLGTGGYVSAPAVLGSRLAGRPAYLVEPNAEPGAANRWLSRFAGEAAVADEGAGRALRCPARVTGVPIRPEFTASQEELPTAPPWRLLVLGGSQGATQLNELLPAALARLPGQPAVHVRHQTGAAHLDLAAKAYREAALPEGSAAEVEPFIRDMAAAMASSHLVVSRAGAITLAEICAAGRPSLLVPLSLAGGHQGGNARRLAATGAAVVFETQRRAPDGEADGLAKALAELLDADRLEEMAKAARQLARPRAAAAIADRVESLARGGRS